MYMLSCDFLCVVLRCSIGLSGGKVVIRDVKKIRTRGYLRIKSAMGRKRILKMDTRYPRVRVFLIPVPAKLTPLDILLFPFFEIRHIHQILYRQ